MADADSNDPGDWREKYDEIRAGFERINNEVKAIACVPMSASESWLLSDANAWREMGLQDCGILPTEPEKIWGERRNPDGDHPHQFFARICRAAHVCDDRETRVNVASVSNSQILEEKCPISYACFATDLRGL